MLDSSWSTDSSQAQSIYHSEGQCLQAGMMYDFGLQRYLLIPANSDSWANPPVESTIYILEAEHPWGPFTKVLEENVQNKEGDNLTWTYPMQKFASADGKKVWMTASGRNPYGLQFMPIYLTTEPVQTYQAESATLTGTYTATSKAGYTGSGYVTGFDAIGDKCQFNVNVGSAGAYILKMRYNTSAYQTINCYVNGIQLETQKLGKSEQVYTTWTDLTIFAWLNNGSNMVTFQYDSGNTGNFNLDKLSLALYSTVEGSLPGCYPPSPWTRVNDTTSSASYSGTWSYITTSSGYYNTDCHYSLTNGSYCRYTFTGTGVRWIGGKNNDHGKADIYMDDVYQTTIDTYDPSWLNQQVLYEKTGLSSGTHTLKIIVTNQKNASSSNYYQDTDAFEYYTEISTEQSPYGGSNWNLPGQIEAENFDVGGEGVAYHDSGTSNQGGVSYRSSEGVDIENCSDTGGGYDVCWTTDGEWLEYTTNIPTGTYNITARAASASGSGMQLVVKLDGVTLGTINISSTGGWQTWQDFTINNISVTGGNGKVLRLEIVNGSFNLNKITFTSSGPTWIRVNDDGSGVTYSGFTNNDSMSGYYNNDAHYSLTNGHYSQFTFTGTGVRWIGAKNNDHGKADIYIDGIYQTTIDTYDSSYLKQLVFYEKTGLSSGSHTLKVTVTNQKNASSSNYYQDVDAFEYTN